MSVPVTDWSNQVEAWNDLPLRDRQAIAATCSREGHQWASSPVVVFCERCLTVAVGEDTQYVEEVIVTIEDDEPEAMVRLTDIFSGLVDCPIQPPSIDELARLALLSPAEERVATGLANGLSGEEIATACATTNHTVKNHITHIFRKLQTNERAYVARLMAWRGVLVYLMAQRIDWQDGGRT